MTDAPKFPIIFVSQAAYKLSSQEMMGSKYKFWFEHKKLGRCLYKQNKSRQDSNGEWLGEDWAEKVATELCKRLGLPHAVYELAATWEDKWGVVSPYFLPEGGTLVHGNELLTAIVPNYPTSGTYRVTQHTIDSVLSIIEDKSVNLPVGWTAPNGIQKAVEVFAGYLLLDAWIGNGDRHHENWGIIRTQIRQDAEETIYLAPTFDHASSLGRELLDSQRQTRSVEAYANKCFSAFYQTVQDKKPLKTSEVFQQVRRRYPQATQIWLEQLEKISSCHILEIFNQIPEPRISSVAREFAQTILKINQQKLLALKNL